MNSPPVTTSKLRLVIWRTTYGHMIDDLMVKLSGWMPTTPHVWLSEIEVYGPRPAVEMTITAEPHVLTQAPKDIPLGIAVVNHGPAEIHGTLRLQAPQGWKIEPEQFSGSLEAGRQAAYRARLVPPRGPLPVGPVPVTGNLGRNDKRSGADRL